MNDDEILQKIAFLLDPFETRLRAVETDLAEIKPRLAQLSAYADAHDKSIWNLSDRMTHESLSILDVIGDMQDKLNPVYDRVVPGPGAFQDEVERALNRRKPRS